MRHALRCGLAALAFGSAIASPTLAGDFGRPKPSSFEALVGFIHRDTGFPLTDAELELRARAAELTRPPSERLLASTPGMNLPTGWGPHAPEIYGIHLAALRGWSTSARYARLASDIQADLQLLHGFIPVWLHVADMDAKRVAATDYVAVLTPKEDARVARRVADNRNIAYTVWEAMNRRMDIYRFALERLVLAAPAPEAVDAERALVAFRAEIVRLGGIGKPAGPMGGEAGVEVEVRRRGLVTKP